MDGPSSTSSVTMADHRSTISFSISTRTRSFGAKLGRKYFGLKRSQLDDQIKRGAIPRPFPLVEGGRATGWLGRQIIAHHHRRIAAQLELSGLQRAHEQKTKGSR